MFAEECSAPWDFEWSIQIAMSVPALATLQYGALVEPEARIAELIAMRLEVSSDDETPAAVAATCLSMLSPTPPPVTPGDPPVAVSHR